MKSIRITFLLLFALLILTTKPILVSASIDSLRQAMHMADSEQELLGIYYALGYEFKDKSLDSLKYYADKIGSLTLNTKHKQYYWQTLNYTYAQATGHMQEARIHLEEALHNAKIIDDKGLLADVYSNMGSLYLINNQLDSAEIFLNKALLEAKSIKDLKRESRTSTNLANVFIKQGKKDKALELAYFGIQTDSLLKDKRGLGNGYKLLGNIHLYSGNYIQAIEAYQKANRFYETTQQPLSISSTLNNIAVVYVNLGQFEKAMEIHRKNLQLLDDSGNDYGKLSSMINLSGIYQRMGRYDENQIILEEALAIASRYNEKEYEAQILNNLGNNAYYTGNYVNAHKYFRQAYEINRIINNKHEQALCQSNMGWALLMLERKDEALQAFEEALQLSTSIKARDKRLMALDGLSTVYKHFGDFKQALSFRNQVMALNDSLVGERTRGRIAELEALYETEKKEREIEVLKQSEIIKQLEINENKLRISRLHAQRTGLGIAALFILMIAFFWTKSLKNKKEREKNLAVIAEREAGLEAVFEATEAERKRIAKDLHDSVGQQLGGLKLAWQNIQFQMASKVPEQKQNLKRLTAILDETAAEVRSISHQMMPRVLQEEGIIPAISDMLEKVFRHSTVSCKFEHYGIDSRLEEKIEIGLYRICQELVSNIIKHAAADQVSVQLFKNAKMLVLLVEDNGKGFIYDKTKREGIGLMNINSRVETIHGEFNLEPSPVSGTLATIRIPTQ